MRIDKTDRIDRKDRIDWDTYFMNIAELAAQRSTCLRRKVGAVLVRDNRILATGYNGSPTGIKNCSDTGECLRQELNIPSGKQHELCKAVHAEANAIIQCAINGTSCVGSTIYVTATPCSMCLKQLINAGVVKIVAKEIYPDELSKQMLLESEMVIELMGDSDGQD